MFHGPKFINVTIDFKGLPGSGKSFLLENIRHFLESKNLEVVVNEDAHRMIVYKKSD